MGSTPTVLLSDGQTIPRLGLGTWPMDDEETRMAVLEALRLGYRLIDTAARYGNEAGVGQALAATDIPRDDVVVTTKLPGAQQGYAQALAGFEESRRRLGVDYVDLYLIHKPFPSRDRYVETWRAFCHLQQEGVVRSIGVSNFTQPQIERLAAATGIWPAVNQVELHPYFAQPKLRSWHADHGIVTEAWRPLGTGSDLLSHQVIERLARAYDRSAAQIVLRWHVQLGNVVIPKSSNPVRMASNLNAFDFTLIDDDMTALSALDRGHRLGGDPDR